MIKCIRMTDEMGYKIERKMKELNIKRKFLKLTCKHNENTVFTITDKTYGSGWMSDSYKVTLCKDCGKVVSIEKIY